MLRRLAHLMKKEFLQLLRDRTLLPVVLLMPVIQLILFGYAASTDIKNIKLAVLDEDRTVFSRQLIEKFSNAGYFTIVERATREKELSRALDGGQATLALRLPRGLQRRVNAGRSTPVQIIADGSNSNTAGIATGYANQILARESARLIEPKLRQLGGSSLPEVEGRVRLWYNPNAVSVNFMVPGLMAIILMIGTTAMTSQAIVRERDQGTLEQLIVTPIRRTELILGKIVPYALVGLGQITFIFLVARFWFAVPFNGSLALLYGASLIFVLAGLGQGLLVSTVSRTRQQAMMTSQMFMMPAMLLSGFVFPLENMPAPAYYASYLVPMRYFLEIVRGVFLKGIGVGVLWPQIVLLSIYALMIFSISVARFNKKLE